MNDKQRKAMFARIGKTNGVNSMRKGFREKHYVTKKGFGLDGVGKKNKVMSNYPVKPDQITYEDWKKLDREQRHKIWENNYGKYKEFGNRDEQEFAKKQPVEYTTMADGRVSKGISGKDLGFATFNEMPLQKGYTMRDGYLKPTPENPYPDYFTGAIRIGMLYDPNGENKAQGDEVEFIDSNTIALTNKKHETQIDSLPHYTIYSDDDKLSDYSGRSLHADKLILYKKSNDKWNITTGSFNSILVKIKK